MKKNYYILTVCLILLTSIWSCKPKDVVTPPDNTTQEYVEVRINGAAPIRYVNKANTGTNINSAVGTREELNISYTPPMSMKNLSIMGSSTFLPMGTNLNIIFMQIWLDINQSFATTSYPNSTTTNFIGQFVDQSLVGTDTLVTSYLAQTDSTSSTNFVKIDEITWDSLGLVKGSFYFENVKKQKTVNNGTAQIISTNNKLEGTFRVKFQK